MNLATLDLSTKRERRGRVREAGIGLPIDPISFREINFTWAIEFLDEEHIIERRTAIMRSHGFQIAIVQGSIGLLSIFSPRLKADSSGSVQQLCNQLGIKTQITT